jgi:Prokaryotic E2 family E
MDLLGRQLTVVQQRYPGARLGTSAEGHRLLIVPGVATGAGWNCPAVKILVLIPAGYPHVPPDSFYTEAGAGLTSGAEPGSSCVQPVLGGTYRWFSWHLHRWDPGAGTLDRYVRFCESRLREAR